ncbi:MULTISPECIES: DinB family protein [unclassified Lysobacter]|uniref:DinB family protein n=1 Tax=unclassified Lysobacter TaxID=2635362 RepID=UPI001C22A1BE|nr:DinB family protein [Lysobacter sp. MMG2]MBU8975919.1 DinB family protein [Lysobacter sp. MMG2]
MDKTTLSALALFPLQLEAHYKAIPAEYRHWTPPSWDGIPSEHFTAIEQLCHVRDIEIEGYHERIRRTLEESHPLLPSIDSEPLAVERRYGDADADAVLHDFRDARARTVETITRLDAAQLARTAQFEGYGPLTLRSLVHYLCSHDQQHLAGLQWLLGKIESERVVV